MTDQQDDSKDTAGEGGRRCRIAVGLVLARAGAAVAIAVLGVRLNPKKTFYAWSPRTTCEDYTRAESEGGLYFHGLDTSGVWRKMRAADVPPVGDPAAPVAPGAPVPGGRGADSMWTTSGQQMDKLRTTESLC